MTQIPSIIGFDTETHLIRAGETVPRLVCATFDMGPAGEISADGTLTCTLKDHRYSRWLVPNSDPKLAASLLTMMQMVMQRRAHLVIQNAAYDLSVMLRYATDVMAGNQVGDPGVAKELYATIWQALDDSLDAETAGDGVWIHDTIIREKLFNLSTHGSVDAFQGRDIRYGLSDLVKLYFDVDISDSKVSIDQNGRIYDHDNNDITGTPQAAAAWRLRYSELDGIPLQQWPKEAVEYAISDATWARRVYVLQEQGRKPFFHGSMNSEALQVYADVALKLYADSGFHVDQAQVARVNVVIDDVLNKVEGSLMINGILRPNRTCNQKVLFQRIEAAWQILGATVKRTPSGDVAAGNEVLEELSGIDPILDMYAERAGLAKIRSAFMPNLEGGVVWSNYDILKETGRVSSYGNSDKSRRKPLFPAVNIQQIPRKHGVRECFLAPPPDENSPRGYVMLSGDYSALELCSVAQVTYSLFGHSVHRDKINEGYDLHTYLGAGMAMQLAPHLVEHCDNRDDAYQILNKNRKLKAVEGTADYETNKQLSDGAKLYRNFSKPTGLGYPGGLGSTTMVTFAKATYGVNISIDQAEQFKKLWHGTYPEMEQFFKWVNNQSDKDGPQGGGYCYETQGLRRFRAGATFCATANGKAMQSLSSDGAKRSVAWVARASLGGIESGPYSILAGCIPKAFIHDENLVAIPDDDLLTVRSLLLCQLMVRAMECSMPDVRITVEPALMRRWTKGAEPEWAPSPNHESKMIAMLGPELYGEMRAEVGSAYRPNKVLIPWDDVNKLKL